jgi:nicotinamide mononucleotide adenylyltransferase
MKLGSAIRRTGPAFSPNSDTGSHHQADRAGSRGIILGKFLPPHRGHEYLGHFAASFVDKLWIFVCSLPSDPIPGSLRVQWMGEMFPHARIVHIDEVNPAANRRQPGAHLIWSRAVREHLDGNPDYVFASEDYGWEFAKSLDSRFIPVDPSRDQFPISGTELRTHPFRHWHYLPDVVRPHFIREIMIEVPNTTPRQAEEIIRKAAMLLNTLYVPVYQHFYSDFIDSAAHPLDLSSQVKAQAALIAALKSQARCFLLRSSLEFHTLDPLSHPADLCIRLQFTGTPASASSTDPDSPVTELACSPDTAAHAIRDLALDRFKDWF